MSKQYQESLQKHQKIDLWAVRVLSAIQGRKLDPLKAMLNLIPRDKLFAPLPPDYFKRMPEIFKCALKELKAAGTEEEREDIQAVLYYIACCYLLNDPKKLTSTMISQIGFMDFHPLDHVIGYEYERLIHINEMRRLFCAFGMLGMQSKSLKQFPIYDHHDKFIKEQCQAAEAEGLRFYQKTATPFLVRDPIARMKRREQQEEQEEFSDDKKAPQTQGIESKGSKKITINTGVSMELKQQFDAKKSDTTSEKKEALPRSLEEEILESARALYVAARKGNLVKVKQLVEQGAPINFGEVSKKAAWGAMLKNALSGAALCIDPEKKHDMIKFLIERGANPDITVTTEQITPEIIEPWNISKIIDINRVETNNPFENAIIQLIDAEIAQRREDAKKFRHPTLTQRAEECLSSTTSTMNSLQSVRAQLVRVLPDILGEHNQEREAAVIKRLLRDLEIRINKFKLSEMPTVMPSSSSSQTSSSVTSTNSFADMTLPTLEFESSGIDPFAYFAIDPITAQSLAVQDDEKNRLKTSVVSSNSNAFFLSQISISTVGDKKEQLLDKSVLKSDKEDQSMGKLSVIKSDEETQVVGNLSSGVT